MKTLNFSCYYFDVQKLALLVALSALVYSHRNTEAAIQKAEKTIFQGLKKDHDPQFHCST